jgi:tetratricopeptide (TPR) repeat protein
VWLRDKLWSESGEEQASASLRQALTDVRRSFGANADKLLISDNFTVSLDLSRIEVDALDPSAFADHANDLDTTPELLEGLDIADPEFEDWLTLERQVWRGRLEDALVHHEVLPISERSNNGSRSTALLSNGSDGSRATPTSGKPAWTVVLMPPSVSGEVGGAGALPNVLAQLLVTSLLDIGDIGVIDFSQNGGVEIGSAAGPVALVVQARYRVTGNQVHLTLCLTRHQDQAMLWMGGTTLDRRAVEIGDMSASHQFINEAVDRLRAYFLARAETHPEEAGDRESLFTAVNAMFRLSRGDLERSEAALRGIIADRPSAPAYAWLSFLMTFRIGQRFADRASTVEQAQAFARKSLEMDANSSVALALVGHVHSFLFGEYDFASGLLERAIRANPSQVLGWDLYSMLQAYAGNPNTGLKMASWGRHLGSTSPYRYYLDTSRCINAALAGDYTTAIAAGEQALRDRPDFNSLLRYLVASHAQLGDSRAARTLLNRLKTVEPDFSISTLLESRYPVLQTEGGRNLIEGLAKAGVKK